METIKELAESLGLDELFSLHFLFWIQSDTMKIVAVAMICVTVIVICTIRPIVETIRVHKKDKLQFQLDSQRHKDNVKHRREKLRLQHGRSPKGKKP